MYGEYERAHARSDGRRRRAGGSGPTGRGTARSSVVSGIDESSVGKRLAGTVNVDPSVGI